MKKMLFLLFLCVNVAHAQSKKTFTNRDLGIVPNSHTDAAKQIQSFFAKMQGIDSIRLVFEAGRYDFYGKNCYDGLDETSVIFDISKKKKISIDGQGSEFIFHGQVIAFNIVGSSQVELKNFTMDWERPYNSQATIVGSSDRYVDVTIDKKEYPYEIKDGQITFIGEGWRKPILPFYSNLYEPEKLDIVYQTRDNPLGMDFYQAKVSENQDGSIRFHFTPAIQPEIGTQLVLFHAHYLANGISIFDSKDTNLENLKIHHALNCAVVAYRGENIRLKNVDIVANTAKKRAFSTIADATHFNGCKGLILFEDCEVTGAGDDFMNIHGMYSVVQEIIGPRQVRLAKESRHIGFRNTEEAWVLDTLTMTKKGRVLQIDSEKYLFDQDGREDGYLLTFAEDIQGALKPGDLLENKTMTADLVVRHCKMYKKNRARSILITSPGKVLIEDNYFNSAGAAILIEGDIRQWFESGAVRDVVIRNNEFENCYTSGNNIVDYPWGWGEAVISITPSVRPKSEESTPYHEHIQIVGNTFKHFDYNILFARSVKDLRFEKNKLIRTYDYKPFYRKSNFYLDGCREVYFAKNTFSEDFLGKNVEMIHMKKTDFRQNKGDKVKLTLKVN